MKKINVPWWQIHKGSLILVNEKYPYFQDDNNELTAVDGSMLERRTATLLSKIMDEFDGWKYITAVSYTHLDVYKRQVLAILIDTG